MGYNPMLEKVFYWYVAVTLGGSGYNFLQHQDSHDHAVEMQRVAQKVDDLEQKLKKHIIKME